MVTIFPRCLPGLVFIVALGVVFSPATASAAGPQVSDVFVAGKDGFKSVRIPSVLVTQAGTVLAFAEGRAAHADQANNKLILKRSRDGGRTWGAVQVIADDGANTLNNPTVVEERQSGRVLLMYQSYPAGLSERDGKIKPGHDGPAIVRNFLIHSDDDGVTWSKPDDVTRTTKRPERVTITAVGPGLGIQLTRGPHAGRLLMPFNEGPFGAWNVSAAFSDDRGATWRLGSPAPGALVTNGKGGQISLVNEVQMVELADGSVMLNSRKWGGKALRKTATSKDGGATWSAITEDPGLPDPGCMASVFRYSFPDAGNKSRLLYSGPDSTKRENGVVRISYDEGRTWPVKRVFFPGSFAYSVLTRFADGTIGCLYETDNANRLVFARFDLAWLETPKSVSVAPRSKPNILFLFADDFSYEAVRAFGHTDVETPNLDRLVARGTTFTHAYNMGSWSGAVCVASRTMLITGRSVWHAHKVYPQTDKERQAGRLWPQLLKAADYQTYFTGKWHIQTKAELAFDVAKNIRAGMPKDTPAAYNRPLAGQPDPWRADDAEQGGFWQGGKHWSEVTADDAIEFLSGAKAAANPFFMYVAFNAPHDPRQSPREFLDKYPLSRMQMPTNFLPEYPHKDAIGCGPGLRDEKLGPFPRTELAVKTHRREYYSLITHLDAQLGRVFEALEKSGQAANTWIFFTADHGLAVGHHGLFGKQNMYEHSLRVPFMVAGPGVKAGHRISAPIYLQDVMPTALELAGVPKPSHVDFHSLLPLLLGERTQSAYPSIYGGYLELQRAVIHEGWKLIAYPKAGVLRLYDLGTDPQEMKDLASEPAQGARRRQLFERLLALQQQLDDTLDLRAAFPAL